MWHSSWGKEFVSVNGIDIVGIDDVKITLRVIVKPRIPNGQVSNAIAHDPNSLPRSSKVMHSTILHDGMRKVPGIVIVSIAKVNAIIRSCYIAPIDQGV